jgi:Raf kinase inhibitor-like YbhB/YbcL family protein
VPDGTRCLALVVDDPDAPVGTFTHWLAWGIDPGAGGLGEGQPAPREGHNGFGTIGYAGPCPPRGRHRYFFRLHALNTELDIEPGPTVTSSTAPSTVRSSRPPSSWAATGARRVSPPLFGEADGIVTF